MTNYTWQTAIRHLRRDAVLKPIIARVGPCTLAPRDDHFTSLCRAIYAQQISTKIAQTLYTRFADKFPRKLPTPRRVVTALSGKWDDATVRHVGLSRQKRGYVLDLATHFCSRTFDPRKLAHMEDEQVIETLTQVKGIGRWTAEMHLIFVLNRPDVLPVDDLGLREAVKRFWNLPDRPKADEIRKIAEPWAPYRSVATWYLWRGLGMEAKPIARKKPVARSR